MSDQTTITLYDTINPDHASLEITVEEGAACLIIDGEERSSCRVEIGDLTDALTLLANHDERAAQRRKGEIEAQPARRQARQAALDRQTIRAARERVSLLIDALEQIEAGQRDDDDHDDDEAQEHGAEVVEPAEPAEQDDALQGDEAPPREISGPSPQAGEESDAA